MTGISISVRVKSNVKLVRRDLDNLRLAIPKIGAYRIREAGSTIRKRMEKPGKKPTYPLRWASKAQQILVMIKLRKAGTLPYVRTGAHGRGWKEEVTKSGIKVYNTMRTSKYLYGNMRGEGQSSIHVGRWLLLRAVYDSVIKGLPKKVIESLVSLPKRAR